MMLSFLQVPKLHDFISSFWSQRGIRPLSERSRVQNPFQKTALWQPKLTLKAPITKIVEFANSVDLNEVAHYEPPHFDLHFLPMFESSI